MNYKMNPLFYMEWVLKGKKTMKDTIEQAIDMLVEEDRGPSPEENMEFVWWWLEKTFDKDELDSLGVYSPEGESDYLTSQRVISDYLDDEQLAAEYRSYLKTESEEDTSYKLLAVTDEGLWPPSVPQYKSSGSLSHILAQAGKIPGVSSSKVDLLSRKIAATGQGAITLLTVDSSTGTIFIGVGKEPVKDEVLFSPILAMWKYNKE